ncbi:MerR family transcriptional regulator [Facklamia sp. 7083-14-GEN3]|uniref:MerR family transcriptional regulator n=1 Tax=Facklamia sp. 7083-14-GEN3 TaxID=2973478 RepID=UPI00215C4157|nr:MerR family transcriptional regulator [Facklamia sp. 7083-14-GEN3]MCR8969616.1 MerR family transcriptional regulator [Facklamia sp. 7083-14-GEN3]
MYSIKEVAEISGVSVRTLHYYDEIGLLIPNKNDKGYRSYDDKDLERLQIILSYKFLGFKLSKIKEFLALGMPSIVILEQQLTSLKEEKNKLLTIIDTLEKTIKVQKGELHMSSEDKFKGFNWENSACFKQEAAEKFGEKVIENSFQRMQGHEEEMVSQMNTVFQSLADHLKNNVPFKDSQVQAQIHVLYEIINTYSFDCSLSVFAAIGKGYVADQRFTQNIDQFGPGTAQYACDAIQYYAEHR